LLQTSVDNFEGSVHILVSLCSLGWVCEALVSI